ncbi:MAG: 30S ribosomal protein S7 [Candidatus Pacebacteria bacterium]|nr:30S ribosomal protein S7 [Candidatus Paceibacterota bacterium]
MRTKQAKRRTIDPDPKYHSTKVAKLINRSMRDGKKTVAQKQVYQALATVKAKTKQKVPQILDEVLQNIAPQMEVRSRRVGGASYQVPMPVRGRRGFSLAVRWLVMEANKRPSAQYRTYAAKLAAEMLDALKHQGGAIERKKTAHRMAESNKAFSHFRW